MELKELVELRIKEIRDLDDQMEGEGFLVKIMYGALREMTVDKMIREIQEAAEN